MNTAVAQAPAAARTGRRSQVESFFRTLILGDFEDHPNTPAEIIGGLLSMIPVLDQVMDARDIAANLYRINAQGGFAKATPEQVVNLGFAAFGAIPTVGSAFKTVFKPLWRERHLAKGAVNGGTQAIEALLGMKKGGAIRWIREELLAKWPARANEAIAQVNLALASCIALLEFIASAGGWKGWLIPDGVQQLAGQALPGMRDMQAAVDATLHRASDEIRLFLTDLLGEQAADVMMAAGMAAAPHSAHAGSRSKQMQGRHVHNAADPKTQGKDIDRQSPKKTQGLDTAAKQRNASNTHASQQKLRERFGKMAFMVTGLIGEHMVDYMELKRLEGTHAHDDAASMPETAAVRKLNADKRPVNLSLVDLAKVPHKGIDAVWGHNGQYTVTEAKARASIWALRAMVDKVVPKGVNLSADNKMLYALLSTSKSEEGDGKPMVQMSAGWVSDRGTAENLPPPARRSLKSKSADRRVVLVTFETEGSADHAQALSELRPNAQHTDPSIHDTHGEDKVHEWGHEEIDAVEKERERLAELKKQSAQTAKPDASGVKKRSRKT